MISNEASKAPGRLDAEKLPSELMTNFGVGPLSCAGTYLRDDSVITHVPTTAVFVWVQPIRTSTANTQSPNRVAIRTNYETPISERLLPIQSGQCSTHHARWPECKRAAISARFGDNLRSIIRLCQWGDLGYERSRSTWMSTVMAKPRAANTGPTTTASTMAWARKARTSAAPSARDRRMNPCCDP